MTGRAERTVMDEATEIAGGRKAHAQVVAEYGGALADARLQACVNDLGQCPSRQSHRASLQRTFTVLDSPDVNAFALPGACVHGTRGILAHRDSEAVLAGVIGHEIGHVTARHGAWRATRAQRAGAGVKAATVPGLREASASFGAFAAQDRAAARQLRLLNGVYGGANLAAGQWAKEVAQRWRQARGRCAPKRRMRPGRRLRRSIGRSSRLAAGDADRLLRQGVAELTAGRKRRVAADATTPFRRHPFGPCP